MTWQWALVIFVLALLGISSFLLVRPLRIPRDPAREGYQDKAASMAYDRTSRWTIFGFERFLVMRALRRLRPGGRLIDIGSGPGYLAGSISRTFPGLQIVGLDINQYMISLAEVNRSRHGFGDFELVMGDASALPFGSNSVQFVVSSLSLHHWTEPARALREIRRVLAPGGKVLLFDVRRDSPAIVFLAFTVGQALFGPSDIRRTNGAVGSLWSGYTASELRTLLSEAGLESVRIDAGPGWLMAAATRT